MSRPQLVSDLQVKVEAVIKPYELTAAAVVPMVSVFQPISVTVFSQFPGTQGEQGK